jgi:hypothetical protein
MRHCRMEQSPRVANGASIQLTLSTNIVCNNGCTGRTWRLLAPAMCCVKTRFTFHGIEAAVSDRITGPA